MTYTTDELREALHAYAEEVPHPDPARLLAGAHRKREHGKRVRTAVIAGAAAVVMAVVAVVGIQNIGHDKALTPAQLNKKHHTHYAEYTHGLKLTDIVDVPLRKQQGVDGQLPDNVLSRAPDQSQSTRIDLPQGGEPMYVACDPRYVSSQRDDFDVQIGSTQSGGGVPCTAFGAKPSLTRAPQEGRPGRWWAVTSASTTHSTVPLALYTEIPWSSYPKSSKLTTRADNSSVQTSKGDQVETIRGTGSTVASRTITLREDQVRLATILLTPSTPGRFQVLVAGTAQRLDYLGYKGGPVYNSQVAGPEVRGTWYDFFPDSANPISAGLPAIYGPAPGATTRISIRAVDTTGPWTARLYWSKDTKKK